MSGTVGMNKETPRPGEKGTWARVWDWFGALRVAIILFILWAALSAVGTLIPQGQEEALYLHKYGQFLGRLILGSGLDHIFTSLPYVVVVALFLGSVFVCSVDRTKRAWRRTFAPKLDFSSHEIQRMKHHRLIVSNRKLAAKDIASHLRHLGFAVRTAGDNESRESFLGRRGTLAPWGMVAVHCSLLIIFIGALVGRTSWFGGFDTNIVIPEGETAYDQAPSEDVAEHSRNWTKHFDFGVRLVDFWIDRDESGFIKEYTSRVEAVDGDKVVKTKDIMVNEPLVYKGIKFYQSSYLTEGAQVEVVTPDGKVHNLLFPNANMNDPEHPYIPDMLGWPTLELDNGDRLQFFAHDYVANSTQDVLPGRKGVGAPPAAKIKIFVVGEQGRAEKWPQVGWVSAEQPVEYQGMKFRLVGLVDSTVLSVRRDPGLLLVWLGCALAVLGMVLGLYLRETTLRVVLSPAEKRTEILAGITVPGDSQAAETYLTRLEKAVGDND